MLLTSPGLAVKVIDNQYACTISVAEELILIAGNILWVRHYAEKVLSRFCVGTAPDSQARVLRGKISEYLARVRALDRMFSRQVKAMQRLADASSSVRLLHHPDVNFDAALPLTLAERRKQAFTSKAEVYAFVAGMCGIGLHTTGDVHIIDLRLARKPIQDWWQQLLASQALCAQLREFLASRSVKGKRTSLESDVERLSLTLTEVAWCYRAKLLRRLGEDVL
ncbi:TPA: hypothetical protein ACRNIQ_004486 [Pseudomonas aeruginosa]|uniref:hypothetical protein n=1 Tax=Pseudomonas aeruginosa TaxID=287 RepID=UPI00129879B0|nr:hypothetical protein [Pseudomonas aeruginosa]MBG4456781.1 hypothetical protein [Pseudomonas aeruginosa]MBG7090218.1 hypothetical protein [Pseudomonas aeruginosa]MBH8788986.1 hypothetical protein [Pseudomonas aeruginosa]MCW5465400.1 hypothetical protein [Pseudomonas aeruginosa]MWW60732.1 hypothetical protein [Pseudomonas aeruginosa]